MSRHAPDIPVLDPFGVTGDGAMPSLVSALDPREAQRHLGSLGATANGRGSVLLRTIRVTRYKPGRRCVIEYDVEIEHPDAPPESFTLVGKVRRLRSGRSGYRLQRALWEAGFDAASPDGISVPEPVAAVPELRMWLQRKVEGREITGLLLEPGGESLARRVAEAAHKLHRSAVPAKRRHTIADELRILRERLPLVARAEPRWAERIERLLEACDRLAETTPEPAPKGIHRDFYADQAILAGDRLYLIDFDLYCEGDPALDIGNFIGHVREQSLRATGNPDTLAGVEEAVEERFVELTGEASRRAVRSYATLTLVRHVHLSTLFPERRSFTGDLLELCEESLGARC